MSQIPRSQQLALKKKSDISVLFEKQSSTNKNQTNGSSNGHKKVDKDVIIIDDEYTAIPVAREEIIDLSPPSQSPAEEAPSAIPSMKKKRGRPLKFSTESRDSDTSETSKKSEVNNETNDEVSKAITGEGSTPETSPKKLENQEVKNNKQKTRLEKMLQDASTIVNLSTVSQSTTKSDDVTLETTSQVVTPERRVSGRRSTRPIDDIKFSYRTPDNLNGSMDDTTNATIGSELGASMLETPAKRRAADSGMDEVEDTPKRSRLDISALFSNLTTPVSLLRNKFMRSNIASTPKASVEELAASEVSLNGSSEMKEIDLNVEEAKEVEGGNDDLKIIIKPLKKSTCSIM